MLLLALGVRLIVAFGVLDADEPALRDLVREADERDLVLVPVPVRVRVSVPERVTLGEAVLVSLDDGVPVWLDVELELAVALDEGVPVWLDVELELAVALDDGVPV